LCVASNIPAHKEALAKNGIYFEKNNILDFEKKLSDTLINYSKLKTIEEDNYKRIEQNFTWYIISNKYEKFCKNLLA